VQPLFVTIDPLLDRHGKVAEVLPHASPADRVAAALTAPLDQPAAAVRPAVSLVH